MSSLVARKIKKSFKQSHQTIDVLKGLDLNLHEGESVAILGPSGSGKSTLLSIIAGFDDPDSGEVLILDKSMARMSEDDRAKFRGKNLGFVFQQYHLIAHLNAFENIMLPLTILDKEDTARVESIIEQVGLSDRKLSFPNQLSGGESQRVAIARALVHNPKLVFADEPSGNLDVRTGDKVMDLLFASIAKNGTSLVLVTHSEDLASRCTRTLRLKDGALHSS